VKSKVSPARFVEVWEMCSSIDEVAKRLKMRPNSISTRASRYRRAGVELKRYSRKPRKPLNYLALNKIVNTARKEEKA
jgi:transposase